MIRHYLFVCIWINMKYFLPAELKMKAIKEREIRESIEKQLIDEQRNKGIVTVLI